jgi:crossover junction endodeoxyribonuclease RuvC
MLPTGRGAPPGAAGVRRSTYSRDVIVLGIDPGTARTGYGVVQAEGSSLRALDHGAVATAAGDDMGLRLARIFAAVAGLLERHGPQAVAIEGLFIGANPRTVLAVGQARGAALAACGAAEIPSAEYSPAQVKTAVCGYGRADKEQVRRMVTAILGLQRGPRNEHAADALAVAICHVARLRTGRALQAAAR